MNFNVKNVKKELLLDPNNLTATNMYSYPVFARSHTLDSISMEVWCYHLLKFSECLKATEVIFKQGVINQLNEELQWTE